MSRTPQGREVEDVRWLAEKSVGTRPIHAVSYASEPAVQIACDGIWSSPMVVAPGLKEIPSGAHVADDGRFYSFDPSKVTCPGCIKKNVS